MQTMHTVLSVNPDKIHSENNIQIFPTTDDRLKQLGEIFSNNSSREILSLLMYKEMTVMQISKESGISANLVIHHLKKMLHSDIVTITRQSKNSRGNPLRFYRAKRAIVILGKNAACRADKNKSLRNVLGKITKLGAIGIAGAFTWIITNSHHALESAFKYPRPALPPYMTPIEPQSSYGILFPVLATVGIVIFGIVLSCYLPKIIRKFKPDND